MKSKVYGYCRVSTMKQSIERQIRNVKAEYPDAIIVTDEFTGTKLDRPGWTKLYKQLKEGDTVVFDQVSRMSRDADEGFRVYEELFNKGVNLIFLKERHIDTATYKKALETGVPLTGTNVDFILEGVNKYLMSLAKEQIRLAFEQAEKEVEDLHQRTREGIETARLSGKQIGQKAGRKLDVKKREPILEIIRKYSKDFDGTLDDIDVMAVLKTKTIKYETGKMIPKRNDDFEIFRDEKGDPVLIPEVREVSAKLARGTYYKYKRELKQKCGVGKCSSFAGSVVYHISESEEMKTMGKRSAESCPPLKNVIASWNRKDGLKVKENPIEPGTRVLEVKVKENPIKPETRVLEVLTINH